MNRLTIRLFLTGSGAEGVKISRTRSLKVGGMNSLMSLVFFSEDADIPCGRRESIFLHLIPVEIEP